MGWDDPRLLAVDTARKGLPRPLALDREDKLRPVPWTQRDDAWGRVSDERLTPAQEHGLCLVCGEFVTSGVVFWTPEPNWSFAGDHACFIAPPRLVTFDMVRACREHVADGAPLHDKCGLLTRSHCAHIRDEIKRGEAVVVPYQGPIVAGLA